MSDFPTTKMLRKYAETDVDFTWFTDKNSWLICHKISRMIVSMHRLYQEKAGFTRVSAANTFDFH